MKQTMIKLPKNPVTNKGRAKTQPENPQVSKAINSPSAACRPMTVSKANKKEMGSAKTKKLGCM
jgi:hypothetical protein